jgi:drug/metabolite transporter (DMT)-like permease
VQNPGVSLGLTAAVLAAALLHATWNAMLKSSGDRVVELALVNLSAGLVALASLAWTGFPGAEAAPYLAASVLFHAGYYGCLLLSYSAGGLSLVYPIARGASPLLVAVVSGVWLGEPLGLVQSAGVLLIALSLGSLALADESQALGGLGLLASLATGVTIAGYTLTDGVGARSARTPASYIATLFTLNALPVLVPLFVWRRGVAAQRLRAQWRTGALGGILSLAAYGLVIWAMTRGAMALVASLRETSVVIAAVIGTTLLGEPFGRRRIVAAAGVALGVVLLRLGTQG